MEPTKEKLKFTKYPSITNSYQQKFLDMLQVRGLTGGRWFVQEKIHGANLSLWTDHVTGDCRPAKRTSFINEADGDFFGVSRVLTLYAPQARLLAKHLGKTTVIFGEICGGHYEGQHEQGSIVQRGVQYCPKNDFLVFDIATIEEASGDLKYLPFAEAMILACNFGLKVAPVLYSGTLEECLEYPNEFVTKVPELIFGLPSIEGNICEGVVIRPEEDRYSSLTVASSRVILKNKNSRFSENEGKPKKATVKEIPVEIQEALDELLVYLNDNRMDALKSKLGEAEFIPKNFGNILGAFVSDAWADIMEDDKCNLEVLGGSGKSHLKYFSLEASQRKQVSKLFSGAAVTYVKASILGIKG